jgi:hypothetical protein
MKKNKVIGYISDVKSYPGKIKYEQHFGVPPESTPISLFSKYRDCFTVHKSAKNGKSSFQITKALLDNLMETQKQIGKNPKLIISIQNYILTCDLRKNNENV